MNIDQITKAASTLGIKLTNANEGTEIYQCWADRVLQAKHHQDWMSVCGDRGSRESCARRLSESIRFASSYAV